MRSRPPILTHNRFTNPEAAAPLPVTHQEAFLQDIIHHPEDDTPRLIFADWLDEYGRPECAEFIRVQIGLARGALDDPRRDGLIEREADLLAEHGTSWRAPLRALGVTKVEFRRGLIEAVQFRSTPSVEQIRAVFRVAPIRELHLWAADGGSIAGLSQLPEARRLRELTIRSRP